MPQALRHRPNLDFATSTLLSTIRLFRQLLETLHVACFPVGVRSRQAAQDKLSISVLFG
ncbi:MAG: hypothetical protein V7K19_29440 [Nostoc sp.]